MLNQPNPQAPLNLIITLSLPASPLAPASVREPVSRSYPQGTGVQGPGCAPTAAAGVAFCSVLCVVLPCTGLPRSRAWGAPGAPAADSGLPPAVRNAAVPELQDPALAEGLAPLLLHAGGECVYGVQKAGPFPASRPSAGCFRGDGFVRPAV